MAFHHIPHPHIASRKQLGAPTVAAAAAKVHGQGAYGRANRWLAVKVTNGVGSMTCAYLFAVLAFISLPDALKAGKPAIVSWIAQTFLQLVLLSIIIVGGNVSAAAADARSDATYQDAEAVLHECLELQRHLEAQDELLATLLASAKVI